MSNKLMSLCSQALKSFNNLIARPRGCSCHAVGLDLQFRPIEYR